MPFLSKEQESLLKNNLIPKHPKSIAIANYKGGVGKTTVTTLLGYYLAKHNKSVLLIDIDPQCSLSLSVGIDVEHVNKIYKTIKQLVNAKNWLKDISKLNINQFIENVPDANGKLDILKGSFDIDELDIDIIRNTTNTDKRNKYDFFNFVKRLLLYFDDKYDYILIDCPPNKMYLTEAMLRASKFFLTVTIPDRVSGFGIPRLLRWIKNIEKNEKPHLLGIILNSVIQLGGFEQGAISQQVETSRIISSIQQDLTSIEKKVIGDKPIIERIPRLNSIASFLASTDLSESEIALKNRKTKNLLTVEQIMLRLISRIETRILNYK